MELAYKHNWPETRERMMAYWAGEIIDRPCIAVTAPGKPARPLAPPPNDEVKWADPEYVAQSYDIGHEATYFGGEAIPGTSLMVGYCFGYGAPLHYMEQTVWQDPIIDDWPHVRASTWTRTWRSGASCRPSSGAARNWRQADGWSAIPTFTSPTTTSRSCAAPSVTWWT